MKVLDLRLLGPETKRRIREGHMCLEAKGVMETCHCGNPCIYDYDSETWICQTCKARLLRSRSTTAASVRATYRFLPR